MGPGGMPYNILGWTFQSTVGLFVKDDVLSTSVYTNPKTIEQYGSLANKRFIVGDLKQRAGEAPKVPNFIAPQRQNGQASNEKIRAVSSPHTNLFPNPNIPQLQKQLFNQIATSNPNIINIRTSILEKRGEAFFLNPSIPLQPWAKRTHGEIAHIHIEAEGSSHVTLSLADAKEVMEKGWGVRHRLSGPFIPVGYLLLYAPRDEEEVEVLGRILRAGVGFMSGGMEVF